VYDRYLVSESGEEMQDRRDQVGTVLRRAEDKLAALMREALEARAYDDVAAIAAISRRLHEIVDEASSTTSGPAAADSRPPSSSPRVATTPRKRPERRLRKGAYPRFMRDGDRLVKVGWSKKEQAEYQHKAPRQAVDALMTALGGLGSNEFSMDALLPIVNEKGEEVPSYQAYLALAWLRSWGGVRRESRGAYSVHPERLLGSEVTAQWRALPEFDTEVADD
jgi:hypothetical protein